MKSKRIALFSHDLKIGGAQRVLLKLADGLLQSDMQVDFVLADTNGPLMDEIPDKARLFDFKSQNYIVMFVKLVKYLVQEKPAVLLTPFVVTSLMAIAAKLLTRVKTKIMVRVSVHLSMQKRNMIWKEKLEQWLVSSFYIFADQIVAVSHGVSEDLQKYAKLNSSRIKVIYNPIIDEDFYKKARSVASHPFLQEKKYPVLLSVGRLTEQKGFSTLIHAFAKVNKSIPSRLIILGDGEEKSALQDLITALEIQDLVDLPGYDKNPLKFMKASDAFVLSSKWEGLPNVLIQAMACGCPIVSTDCPSGPKELLNNGEYGYLVPVGDVDGLAEAIQSTLIGNIKSPPPEWLKQFEVSEITKKYLEIF